MMVPGRRTGGIVDVSVLRCLGEGARAVAKALDISIVIPATEGRASVKAESAFGIGSEYLLLLLRA